MTELDNDMIEAIHIITEASKKTKFKLVHFEVDSVYDTDEARIMFKLVKEARK